MDWISRLNAAPPLTAHGVELYRWNYAAHLLDNVAHRHTYFEICLVGAYGHGVFTVEGEPFPIASGDLFIARPGVVHRIQNRGAHKMELFWVAFDWSEAKLKRASESDKSAAASEAATDLFRALANSPTSVARDDGLTAALWHTLRTVASGPQHAGKDAQLTALQNALLLQIAALGAGQHAPDAPLPAPTPHRLARLGARYIHDNMGHKLSVAEIAAHLHLSPRHFGRLFAEFAEVSPSAYIETARIDRARHLLRSTDQPVKTIAAAVGLPDVHHFTRVFSKRCAISPAAFRHNQNDDVRIIHKEGALV